ncbi:MAG TPA: LysM peptidoglycan-binding domain-containing protein, partial [Mucilaginibacter sp.]
MKLKLLLLTLTLTAFSLSVFARPLADSIGVENHNGKKVILHKLNPKDNYYSIGRRYHVSPKTIIQYNNNAKMTIGNVIKVPTDIPFDEETKNVKAAPAHQNKPVLQAPVVQPTVTQPAATQPQQTQPANANDDGTPTQYKVSAGETLYSIAKRFNTTVED